MDDAIDPVTLEVLWSRLRGLPREMGSHLSRTAYSAVIKYARDFSTATFTADGRMLAQGVYAPGHLGSMPFMVRKLFEHFPRETWEPGDVVLTNDPRINSGHLPDLFVFAPVFYEGDLRGFCVIGGHHLDIGGAGTASYTMHVTDLYAEGIQVPPVKLYDAGEPDEKVFDIVTANSREPEKLRGDLEAQIGATQVGQDLFCEILEEHGVATAERYFEEILDRSEERMRTAIDDVPDGVYEFEDRMDGFDEPLPVHATITVDGTELEVDFAGTADQVPGRAINAVSQYTFAYTMLGLKSVIDPDSPQTQGAIEPVTVTAPEGSLLNAQLPVPVGSRQLVADRVISTVVGALNEAVPGETPAPGGQPHRQMFKFTHPETGELQVLFDGHYGGAGARPERDGNHAVAGTNNLQNTPVEAIESEYPMRINTYRLRPDSSGAGRYRGGAGTVREYEFDVRTEVQLVNERFKFGPFGVQGAGDGRPGAAILNPDGEARDLHSKEQFQADAGDVLRVFTPGGGGYGEPNRRPMDAVRADVRDGVLSPEVAERRYDVELD
ncbi:MAG: hydantoinase B/oxoprolinase family protein [Salinirussus sp.]